MADWREFFGDRVDTAQLADVMSKYPVWDTKHISETTPTQNDNHIELRCVVCSHADQAIQIAEYICEEIQKNSNSKEVFMLTMLNKGEQDDDMLQKGINKAAAYKVFHSVVSAGSIWDHKTYIRKNFPTKGNSTQYYHKYKKYEYYFDIWSNIHYGYIGLKSGFSESELLHGAGIAQIFDNNILEVNFFDLSANDDIDDQISIKIGFDLYYKFQEPSEMKPVDILNCIENASYEIYKGETHDRPKSEYEKYAKLMHRCYYKSEEKNNGH